MSLARWSRAHAFSPSWLPGPLAYPLVGYLFAIGGQLVALLGTAVLVRVLPDFTFPAAVTFLVITLVALGWGLGPGLLSSLVGALLVNYFLLPPHFSWSVGDADLVGFALVCLVGGLISRLASQSEVRRRQAERLAQFLALEQARLGAVLEAIPDLLTIHDVSGSLVQANAAGRRGWIAGLSLPLPAEQIPAVHAFKTREGEPVPLDQLPMTRALRGETVTGVELRQPTPGGSERTLLVGAAPIRTPQGQVDGCVVTAHDVTALRLAEQQAAAQARQLASVIETITDGVYVYTANGSIQQINRAGQALLQRYLPGDDSSQPVEVRAPKVVAYDEQGKLLPPESFPAYRVVHGETLSGPTSQDMVIETLDGGTLQLNVSGAPIRNEDGSQVGAVIVARDVTERRRLEREAAEQAGELEAIFEALTDGVVVFSAQGQLLRMNPAAQQFLGVDHVDPTYTLDRTSPNASRFIVRNEQGQPLTREHWPISRLLRGETITGANAADLVLRSLSEQERQVTVTGAPIRDQHGKIRGAVSVFHDVTERRRLERRTREALTALLAMAETLVQVPPTRASQDITAPVPNRAAQRLVEVTRNVFNCKRVSIAGIEPVTEFQRPVAAIGLSPEEERFWWHEQHKYRISDGADPTLAPRLRAGEMIVFDFTRPPYSESPNPYQVKTMIAAPMRVGEQLVGVLGLDYGSTAHIFTADELALAGAVAQLGALVLEQERLLHERAEAEAKVLALQEANQRLETFISIVSHELRTPVTSLKANLQLVLRRVQQARDADDVAARLVQPLELLERMEQQMRRLTRLLEDVIDLARIRTGKLDIEMEPSDLRTLLVESVRAIQTSNPERTIQIDPPPDQEVLVLMDAGRIEQVIANYLTNALKYSSPETPVMLGLSVEGGQARVWVRDQGPGIPAEDQPRVWDLFHRVPGIEVQSGSGIGLGLGLHISKMLIERQGGQVGVESVPGTGSTFWFTLPLLPTPTNLPLAN